MPGAGMARRPGRWRRWQRRLRQEKQPMGEPLITAVIPTYNYGRFVTGAVAGGPRADVSPCRGSIVVDDGSTDDTRQRLMPYLDRIRYIRSGKCRGAGNRTRVIRAASADWIAPLDADDVWHPRKLELQLRCLREQPVDIGLLATDLFFRSAKPLFAAWTTRTSRSSSTPPEGCARPLSPGPAVA